MPAPLFSYLNTLLKENDAGPHQWWDNDQGVDGWNENEKNYLQEEPFWEGWGGVDSHNMDIWNWNFCCMIDVEVAWFFGGKQQEKFAPRSWNCRALKKEIYCAPEKEKFALKNKGDKYASSEIPKKIKAHHIAQLYDRLKQFCCHSVQALDSMSVDATSAAGVLLLFPLALSPAAAALLCAWCLSPLSCTDKMQTKLSSNIRKLRWGRLQCHIWRRAS